MKHFVFGSLLLAQLAFGQESCDESLATAGDYYWDTTDCSFCVCECSTDNSGSTGGTTTCVYSCSVSWTDSDAQDYIVEQCQLSDDCLDYKIRDDSVCSCEKVLCPGDLSYTTPDTTDGTYLMMESTRVDADGTGGTSGNSGTDASGGTDNGRTDSDVTTHSTDKPNDDDTHTPTGTETKTDGDTTSGHDDTTNNNDMPHSTDKSSDNDGGSHTDNDGTSDTPRSTDKEEDDGTNENTRDGTDDNDYDTSDADEDEFLDDDSVETVDDADSSSPYLYAEVEVSVTKLWYSRSDVWSILKRALHYILEDSSDYDTDGARRYIRKWRAYRTDDDSDTSTSNNNDDDDTTDGTTGTDGSTNGRANTATGTGRRRMLLQTDGSDATDATDANTDGTNAAGTDGTDGATDGRTDGTDSGATDGSTDDSSLDDRCDTDAITMEAGIAVYDGDIEVIEKLYNYIIDLATSFGTDYSLNCANEAETYRTCGWGDVTVVSAYIAYYDESNVLQAEESYTSSGTDSGTDGPTGANQSPSSRINPIYSGIVSVLLALFVFVWV